MNPEDYNPLTMDYNPMHWMREDDRQKVLNFSERMFNVEKRKTREARTKAGLAVAGVGAAVGAGTMAKKMYDKKKAEKTALDIINEAFEKQAGLKSIKNIYTGKRLNDAINARSRAWNTVMRTKDADGRFNESALSAFREARQLAVNEKDKMKRLRGGVKIGATGLGLIGASKADAAIRKAVKKRKENLEQ